MALFQFIHFSKRGNKGLEQREYERVSHHVLQEAGGVKQSGTVSLGTFRV